jgi:hypothetical protein
MSSVVIAGNTSGSVTLSAPDVAGTTTLTLPSTSGTVITSATSTGISASALSTGTVPTARLASGTADSTTYLRGDQTWAVVSSGPSITAGAYGAYATQASVQSNNTSMIKLLEAQISYTGTWRIRWNHWTKPGYGLTTYSQIWKNGVNQSGNYGSSSTASPGTFHTYDGSFTKGDLVQIYGAAYASDVWIQCANIFCATADGQAFTGLKP